VGKTIAQLMCRQKDRNHQGVWVGKKEKAETEPAGVQREKILRRKKTSQNWGLGESGSSLFS